MRRIVHNLVLAALLALTVRDLTGQVVEIQLPASVDIRAEVIRLADLLPPGITQSLKQKAAVVLLGQSPQIGSVRMLERNQIERALPLGAQWRWNIPQQIVVRRVGFAISEQALLRVLKEFDSGSGSSLQNFPSASLHWSPLVEASKENPELRVVSARWNYLQATRDFSVRCADPGDCGKFLVQVDLPRNLLGQLKGEPVPRPARPSRTASPVVAEAGHRMLLLLERSGVRISVPAICLEAGVLHQQVRVRAFGGGRVYRAEVIGPDRLHAWF